MPAVRNDVPTLRANCVWYALREYLREHRAWRHRGCPAGMEPRLLIRTSRLAPRWMLHFAVGVPLSPGSPVYAVRSFVPVDQAPLRWWQVWRAAWFVGRVQHGDSPAHRVCGGPTPNSSESNP